MRIRTINNFEELETLRSYWESWQAHPNSDFEHFQLVCRVLPQVKEPYVVVVEDDGKPLALLAGRLEQTHFSTSVGYLNLGRIPAKVLFVVYQGLLGEYNEVIGERLFKHLWSCLCTKKVDSVVLHYLPEKSPLLGVVLSRGSAVWCEKRPVWSTHRVMDLPQEPGLILGRLKSNHRRRIRGKEKKLNASFRKTVSWRWMDRFEGLQHLCAQLEEVAKHTYQRGLGAGFFNNEEHLRRFSLFAQRGELRMQVLQIQDKIKAFWIGTVYKGVFYASETGYDPELREFEVGTLGFVKAAEGLALEGVRKVDFGFGDAAYKKRFATQSWEEATVRLFAPTAKGLLIRLSLGGSRSLDTAARQLVHKLGVFDLIKRHWRGRLAKTAGRRSPK
jgi:hypothetical protein